MISWVHLVLLQPSDAIRRQPSETMFNVFGNDMPLQVRAMDMIVVAD